MMCDETPCAFCKCRGCRNFVLDRLGNKTTDAQICLFPFTDWLNMQERNGTRSTGPHFSIFFAVIFFSTGLCFLSSRRQALTCVWTPWQRSTQKTVNFKRYWPYPSRTTPEKLVPSCGCVCEDPRFRIFRLLKTSGPAEIPSSLIMVG